MMTKQQLYRHMQDHMSEHGVKLTRDQTSELFEELERTATSELIDSGEFMLPGIAKLKVTDRAARRGRNPGNGTVIDIPAKRVVKAKVSKGLQDALVEAA